MKTLHVTNRLYPEFNGGTEIHVYELCRELAKAGEKTIILTQVTDPKTETIATRTRQDGKVKIYSLRLPPLTTKIRLLRSFLTKEFHLVKFFLEIVRKEKPDIVHFHHLYTLSPLLPIICRFQKISHLIDLVDYWFLCPNTYLTCRGLLRRCATKCVWSGPVGIPEVLISRTGQKWLKEFYGYLKVIFHRLLWRFILNHTNSLLVPISERTKEIYQQNGIRARMVVKPCGIPIKRRLSKKTPGKILNIGYIGALIPVKGIKILISAFKKLTNKSLTLTLYGQNGFPDNTLANLVGSNKRILLAGAFDHQDLGAIYSSIDILVVPSTWEEAFGIVVAEGQAANIPVVISSIGGMGERIIDGVNGFLVRHGSAQDLSVKIKYIVNNYHKVCSKLKTQIGQFKIEQETSQVINIYHAVLANKPLPNYTFSKKEQTWIISK